VLALLVVTGCGGVTVLQSSDSASDRGESSGGAAPTEDGGADTSDPATSTTSTTAAATTSAGVDSSSATSDGVGGASSGEAGASSSDSSSTAPDGGDTSASTSSTGTPCCDGTEGSASTGELDGPPFVDVTAAAGLTHEQGTPHAAGNCLIDATNPPVPGLFCSPERVAGGAAVADVDGDGWLDVFITRPYDEDLLYRNQGDGTFVDIAADVGITGTLGTAGAAFGDVDDDGDQDLYVTTLGALQHLLFIQEDGLFTEQAMERGAAIPSEYQHAGSSIAFADYDLDGDLDLYVGEWRTHALGDHPSHNRLLRNLGPDQPGYFEDVTLAAGIAVDDVWQTVDGGIAGAFVLSVGWTDLDADGWPDLLLASDFAVSRLFWNSGDGTFVDGTVASGVGTDENGMGSASADYDRDGDADWFVTSINGRGKTGNRMYRNDGGRLFTDVTDEAGVRDAGWGWGAAFVDHDLDADLDLVATNGWYATAAIEDPMVAWTLEGDAYVAEQDLLGLVDTGQGRGLVAFDADNDGDLEILVVNNRDSVKLFRNDTPRADRHWLRVQTPGVASNRDGIGAIVTVTTDLGPQRAEIGGTSHLLGHDAREAHFGLADAATADVSVVWPASGATVALEGVAADQVLVVPEP
jgi:hypothetical protein